MGLYLRAKFEVSSTILTRFRHKKKTESKNPKVVRTKNGRIILLSNYMVCDSKILTFIKEEETSGFLSRLGIKTPLSKVPLVGPFLF